MGAGQAKARIAPTAPRLSDGSSWWAEPTMIWKPTSFCRVFNFPTTVTAEDEGFVPLPSPSRTGGDGRPPPFFGEPAREGTLSNYPVRFLLPRSSAFPLLGGHGS